ncbi:glycosyltransferase [Aureococcus anophagefferens]|nr:glycosyltransferase [Aureococcus anophagefferens]
MSRIVAAKDRLPGRSPPTTSGGAARWGAVTFRSYCWKGLTEVPEEALKHDTLEKLWLHNNDLVLLPPRLGSLVSLRVLTLSRNARLADPWDVLATLANLVTLELNGAGLERAPESLGNLAKLERLELGENRLRVLPEALGTLRELANLDVSANRLEALPVCLKALPKLAEVQAFHNAFATVQTLGPACTLWGGAPGNPPVWEGVATPFYASLMTVCVMDENVRWLEEFLIYHLHVGFDHVYLYDNSGTAGCHCVDANGDAYESRGTTYERNKYGFELEAYAPRTFAAIAAKFPGRVTRVPWTPRDEHGFVTYGQNEALRHYVDNYGGDSTWCCFTDLDEYVFSPSGRDLRRDLEEYGGGRDAPAARAEEAEWRFNHYNANPSQLQWMFRKHLIKAPALDDVDAGMRRYAGVVAGIRQPAPLAVAKNPMPIARHSLR